MAVVGASAEPSKWGYWLARGALAGRDRRRVHLVNRAGRTILGRPSAPSLRAYPLLTGWRGRPQADVRGLAEIVAAVSRAISEHPELAKLELNPVRVGPDGALAVDALLVPGSSRPRRTPGPEPG